MADAQYLVTHFSPTVGAGHERADPYFTKGAERLIGQLVVAAARAGDRTLRDVRDWLATRSEEPVGLLRAAGLHAVGRGLQGTLEAPARPARRALRDRADRAAAAWSPRRGPLRHPAAHLGGPAAGIGADRRVRPVAVPGRLPQRSSGAPCAHDTLYLLTREGAGTGAPVVAAMVDHMLRTAAAAATARGGRVDPPVRAVLDEAANICPIRNLPDLYSYFGSMSMQAMTLLQSYQQGVAVWGRAGMDKLWSAATVKLIGAGVHDADFCENISRLVGEHEVPTWSLQHGHRNHSSTWSTRRERILSAADIAALPKTTAVLIAAGRRPGQLQLLPWYQERMAENIRSYAAAAEAEVSGGRDPRPGARQPAGTAANPRNQREAVCP